MGHAITINSTLHSSRITPKNSEIIEYSCSGTPADCVKLAINELMPRKPDLCVSGINHGSNSSINVIYSGTMSAAIEAGIEGVPAIGDFKTARKFKKKEWIHDYFMQAAAYALAHNEVYGTNIQKGVIFMVTHDNQYQQFVVEGEEFKTFTNEWLDKVETYYKMNK